MFPGNKNTKRMFAQMKTDRLRKRVKRQQPIPRSTIANQLLTLQRKMTKNAPPTKSVMHESGAQTNIENAFVLQGFNYPAKGGAKDERLGDEIELKSINIRGIWEASSSDGNDSVRLTIFQWLDATASGSVVSDFAPVMYALQPSDYPNFMPFNSQNTQSYRILYDQVKCLNTAGIHDWCFNILLTPKDFAVSRLHFDADTGGGTPALREGGIYMMTSSDSAATPNPHLTYEARINYTDT